MDAVKVLDRVHKLMALALSNPHAEEARSAALKACELMSTHRVQLSLPISAPPRQPGEAPWASSTFGQEQFDRLREQLRQQKAYWSAVDRRHQPRSTNGRTQHRWDPHTLKCKDCGVCLQEWTFADGKPLCREAT